MQLLQEFDPLLLRKYGQTVNLNKRLQRAREHARLTQKALEGKSGVSQKTISKIERGDQGSSSALVQLATACGVRPEWLATGTGPMVQDTALKVAESAGTYEVKLSTDARDVAMAFQKLTPASQEMIRTVLFVQLASETNHPWLRRGRPKGENYDEWEKRMEQNFAYLAAQHEGKTK
jgi:transcriptional regulator with XRE-family HTH domain